jgi:hypothetical protein
MSEEKRVPPTWILPANDPRRVAAEIRQLRLLRELEHAAKLFAVNTRPKEQKQ